MNDEKRQMSQAEDRALSIRAGVPVTLFDKPRDSYAHARFVDEHGTLRDTLVPPNTLGPMCTKVVRVHLLGTREVSEAKSLVAAGFTGTRKERRRAHSKARQAHRRSARATARGAS